MLLNLRLRQLGLKPVDVGDGGDCFFRLVSHQLYGDPSHHLSIRQAGVQYLSNNPERFIESNTENSWNECINIMSMHCLYKQLQTVKMQQFILQNLTKILQGKHYLAQHPSTTIYLGHLDELHFVSTAAVTCGSDALENQHNSF